MTDNDQNVEMQQPAQSSEEKRKGGIAWGGSLVGVNNPDNLGYRYSTPSKRYRTADGPADGGRELPSSIQVQFRNRQGEELAQTLDIPLNSTVDELTALVHSLIEETEGSVIKNPYSFYTKLRKNGVDDDVEIATSLLDFLQKETSVSTEAVLELTYQPLAVFRVRPVARCTDTLPGHTEAVLHVQYAPDGRMLASGGGDTTVRFWDVNTSTPKFTCKGHKNHVLCTSWSPDGKRFVSADKNGVVIFWDPTKGESVGKHLKAHKQWITAMAWEPMHLNADCERLATAGKDSTIRIWNVRTQALIKTLSGHTDSVEAVKWGGEGLIYSASRDR